MSGLPSRYQELIVLVVVLRHEDQQRTMLFDSQHARTPMALAAEFDERLNDLAASYRVIRAEVWGNSGVMVHNSDPNAARSLSMIRAIQHLLEEGPTLQGARAARKHIFDRMVNENGLFCSPFIVLKD